MENFKSLFWCRLTANFLEMNGNEENAERDPFSAFVFIAVFSFRTESEGAAVYGGLVANVPS
jgi:hypothetical protein